MVTLLASNAIPMTQIAYPAASITASYTLAGSFTGPAILATIVSTLDEAVQISFDGVNDHIAVPAGDTVPVCIPLNFKCNLAVLPLAHVFVKEIVSPTTGSLYISGFTSSIV